MANTLQAGDVFGEYQGYYPDFGIGSLSPNTFGGFTCSALITGVTAGRVTVAFSGDATAFLTGQSIVINGTTYSTITGGPSFDGSVTSIEWAYAPGNFNTTPGSNEYTISIGAGGPANPNITSPSTVPNLIGTKLAHTVTIDKTAASMAITGGADSADFEVTGTTGLRFVGDALSDTAGNLVVEVTVTDTDGLTATQTITVPVKYILYVGGKTWSRAGATSTTNVSLTDLTGGIASAPAENDYVVVMQGIGSNADRAVATTSGYTELADIYANGTTYDANLGVDAKFMGSTPDTTVTIGSSGSANDAQAARIMVFRGVDLTTPMDVAVVTATGTGTAKPNPGAITPITTGSVGVFSGAQAAATAAALTSSDLTAFASVNQADTNDIAVGAGYIEWSGSGAMDPAVFGGGSNNSANSWAAVSIALRPAYAGGDVSASIGAAGETDSASALGRSQRRALGSAGETDSAATLSGYQARAVGVAGESDGAEALAGSQRRAIGRASETDSAAALAAGGTAIGAASETDSAGALTGSQRRALGVAAEDDAAAALIGAQRLAVGAAAEANSAAALVGAQVAAIGIATETDSAGAAAGTQRRAVGTASESDAAAALSGAQRVVVGAAPESDTAAALTASAVAGIGIASESDSALPMTAAGGIGAAIETDSALALTGTQTRSIGVAGEADSAATLVLAISQGIGVASEDDSALPMVAASEVYTPRRTVRHSAAVRMTREPAVADGVRGDQVSVAARGSRARQGSAGGRPAAISRGSR